jgi:hypothetical protein
MRTDIHRPGVIVPADYEYVCLEYIRIDTLGDCEIIKQERAIKDAHFARTGGRYAQHEHGGNCMVCGAAAVYTVLFYHAKTNAYIRTGQDCAQKMEMAFDEGRYDAFRKSIKNVLEAKAGKRKAQALLESKGLGDCWWLYDAEYSALPVNPKTIVLPHEETDLNGQKYMTTGHPGSPYTEEITVRDIVGKLVKYGSITERTENYLHVLLKQISQRSVREAKFAAEREAAAPCPTGRVTVSGTILKIAEHDGYYGTSLKMTVKAEEGYIVWLTLPSAAHSCKRGDAIKFVATITPSDNDPKFGFGKRPHLVSCTSTEQEAIAA